MRAEVPRILSAALIAFSLSAARAGDTLTSLADRLKAAAVVVEGEAGRPYTAWNGADPATIVTYTPFAVRRVLKGRLASASILLREPGGEVGGVNATGEASAEFVEGERDVVLLGDRDPRDGSFPITITRGIYQVTRDANGRDGLDVHLGVDAGTYPSREKGSGTPPKHVPLELVESLARDERVEIQSSLQAKGPPASPPVGIPANAQPQSTPSHREWAVVCIAALTALLIAGLMIVRGRRVQN